MAIIAGGAGGTSLVGGALSGNAPSSTQPGDILLLTLHAHTSSGLPADPGGAWILCGKGAVQNNVSSLGGYDCLAVYVQMAQSAGTGAASFSWGAGDILSSQADSTGIRRYREDSLSPGTFGWQIDTRISQDASHDQDWDPAPVTFASAMVLNDLVLACTTADSNGIASSPTGYSLTGATFTHTGVDGIGGFGDGLGWTVDLWTCTASGGSTLTYHFDYTFRDAYGYTAFVRLRAFAPAVAKQAPTITLVDPPEGALGAADTITVDVEDKDGVADFITITPRFIFPNLGITELAHSWEDIDFTAPYLASSTRTVVGSTVYRYVFERSTGWGIDTQAKLFISAKAGGAGQTTDEVDALFEWTVTDGIVGIPGACPEPDTEITLVSPAIGSTLEPATNVVIDVVDPGVGRTFTTVITINGDEVYSTAEGWSADFDAASDVDDIDDGSRYTIDPDADWGECAFVRVDVTDEDDLVTTEWFWFLFTPEEEPDEEPLPEGDSGLPKLEGHIKVPTGGWSFDIVEPGAQETITIPAGNYWLASGHAGSLVDFIEDALNAHPGDLVGDYTVTVNDDYDNSTGQVTFTATGVASIELDFTAYPALRRALGFSQAQENAVGGTTITGAYSSPHIWLSPVCRSPALSPDGALGVPLTDGVITVSSSGHTKGIQRSLRRVDRLEFAQVQAQHCRYEYEEEFIVNGSFETFWINSIGKSRRVRYHKRRSNDAVYRTYRCLGINAMAVPVEPETSTWTSDPESLWHIGPVEVLCEDPEPEEL